MTASEQATLADLDVAGELVRLRPVRPEDAEHAFPMLHGRDAVLRWLVWQGPFDREELADAYGRWLRATDAGANYMLAIEPRAGGPLAGTLSLRFVDHPFVGDVGYWLGERWWGRGFATEAVRLAAHVAFRHLASTALVAEVFHGNDASARVLAKVGFERQDAVELAPLSDTPVDIDRPKWQFALPRRRFARLHTEWAPARDEVRLDGAARR